MMMAEVVARHTTGDYGQSSDQSTAAWSAVPAALWAGLTKEAVGEKRREAARLALAQRAAQRPKT
jgi:hypothetical protein